MAGVTSIAAMVEELGQVVGASGVVVLYFKPPAPGDTESEMLTGRESWGVSTHLAAALDVLGEEIQVDIEHGFVDVEDLMAAPRAAGKKS